MSLVLIDHLTPIIVRSIQRTVFLVGSTIPIPSQIIFPTHKWGLGGDSFTFTATCSALTGRGQLISLFLFGYIPLSHFFYNSAILLCIN